MTMVRARRRISRVTVEELLDEMHRSVDGLGEDGASRADLKLLSRTLKELRHAFRFNGGRRGRLRRLIDQLNGLVDDDHWPKPMELSRVDAEWAVTGETHAVGEA